MAGNNLFGKQAQKTFNEMKKKAQRKRSNIKNRYGIDLSGEIQIPSSIDEFESRSDYFKWKKQINSFTDRKNPEYRYIQNKHGLVITQKQFNELKQGTAEHRRKAFEQAESMKDLPYIEDGKVLETLGERAEKTSIGEAMGITMPKQFDREAFEKIKDPRTIGAKIEANEKRKDPDFYDERMIQMQKNYIELMFFVLNQDDPEQLKTLEIVQNMNPDDFNNMYHSNLEALAFEMYPSPKKHAEDGKIPSPAKMLQAIEDYEKLKVDRDSLENKLGNF